MRVLMFNGSPDAKGCTYTALCEVADALEKEGIEAEIIHIGGGLFHTCTGCGSCRKSGRCMFTDDCVNDMLEKAKEADAFVFGTPVHYASASGAITAFLDRFFYAGAEVAHKPGAVVASCRRGGSSAAIDQLQKYCTISQMPLVSSCYWNMVHGNTPDEVRQDLEGMQVMRTLGRNMAWLLKCIGAGKAAGIEPPQRESPRARTNFIR